MGPGWSTSELEVELRFHTTQEKRGSAGLLVRENAWAKDPKAVDNSANANTKPFQQIQVLLKTLQQTLRAMC